MCLAYDWFPQLSTNRTPSNSTPVIVVNSRLIIRISCSFFVMLTVCTVLPLAILLLRVMSVSHFLAIFLPILLSKFNGSVAREWNTTSLV